MMTLIWLIQFDERWLCFHCPIIQSMWYFFYLSRLFGIYYCILMSLINLYSIYFQEYCQFATKHLLINSLILSILATFAYIIYNKMKIKRNQIQKYQNRIDISYQLNNWTIRKVLLSKIGYSVFLLGIIQNIWAFNTFLNLHQMNDCSQWQPIILKLNILFTILASIPVIFVIISYIIIKTFVLITSSVFPHFYISLKRTCIKNQTE